MTRKDNLYATFKLRRSDCWSLDAWLGPVIAEAICHYKMDCAGWPGGLESQEEWFEILDAIVLGFSLVGTEDWPFLQPDAECAYERAKELFAKWFGALWY